MPLTSLGSASFLWNPSIPDDNLPCKSFQDEERESLPCFSGSVAAALWTPGANKVTYELMKERDMEPTGLRQGAQLGHDSSSRSKDDSLICPFLQKPVLIPAPLTMIMVLPLSSPPAVSVSMAAVVAGVSLSLHLA